MIYFAEPFDIRKGENILSWTFIQKDNAWWLKISTIEEYLKYRNETDSKIYGDIVKDMINVTKGYHETNPATTCILFENRKYKGEKTLLELVTDFSSEISEWQIEYLLKGYYLLFNPLGGCHFDTNPDYKWIHQKYLVFPEFKETDIKIEKFPDGKHYYAYIGTTQVRDNDILKWNTYEEAYKQAKTYITSQNKH